MTGFDRFANDLPWGWWLRADATGVEDEQGRRWKSVRDAFWRGRLGFPDVAHRRGYVFASASVEPQDMAGGVLRVKFSEGRIDAVRVIGAKSQLADQILTGTLATGQAATRASVERAIQLVDDIPGIDVKESRFIRQDGFGILLVTIETDRASAYVQVDNRGTREVGPIRATMIGSLRGLFREGDELGTDLYRFATCCSNGWTACKPIRRRWCSCTVRLARTWPRCWWPPRPDVS